MNRENILYISQPLERFQYKFQEPIEDLLALSAHGDIDAVGELYLHLDEPHRAELMVMMSMFRFPIESIREMLKMVWDHEHNHLVRMVGIQRVKAIFRQANFKFPDETPETLTIYRGGFGISHRKLASGLSWTTNRDVACFFAMRYEGEDPLVLKAVIHREEIRLIDPDQRENEIVVFGARRSVIDGEQSDWAARYKRYIEEKDRWSKFGS